MVLKDSARDLESGEEGFHTVAEFRGLAQGCVFELKEGIFEVDEGIEGEVDCLLFGFKATALEGGEAFPFNAEGGWEVADLDSVIDGGVKGFEGIMEWGGGDVGCEGIHGSMGFTGRRFFAASSSFSNSLMISARETPTASASRRFREPPWKASDAKSLAVFI